VAADHDAPVRQTARFSDGLQSALTLLGGGDKIQSVVARNR